MAQLRSLGLIAGLAMLAMALPMAASGQTPSAATRMGVSENPCDLVAPVPQPIADFIESAAKARASGAPLPPPTPEGMAMYQAWQKEHMLADFGDFCHYEGKNRSLPPASATRVVFMGDSITEGWQEARPAFFGRDRLDRGVSGQTTSQMLLRFYADVIDLHPATVHILAGTNDIAQNTGPTSLARIQNNIRAMVELAQAHRIRVILATLLPTTHYPWQPGIDPVPAISALNSWIKSYARVRGVTVVDYFAALDNGNAGLSAANSTDGVHPTALGYAKMEAALTRVAIQPAVSKKAPITGGHGMEHGPAPRPTQ